MWESCSSGTRDRAQQYAERHNLAYVSRLGYGIHGIVLLAERQDQPGRAAVKCHDRSFSYHRERDAYLRLRQCGIQQIQGHNVPQLLAHDDELLIIEMSVVTRPYLLDFGGAYLDTPPDYPEHVLADWRAEKADPFGVHWPSVTSLLQQLAQIGIYLADVNPGNIGFLVDETD